MAPMLDNPGRRGGRSEPLPPCDLLPMGKEYFYGFPPRPGVDMGGGEDSRLIRFFRGRSGPKLLLGEDLGRLFPISASLVLFLQVGFIFLIDFTIEIFFIVGNFHETLTCFPTKRFQRGVPGPLLALLPLLCRV